jgi:hypothetical protein
MGPSLALAALKTAAPVVAVAALSVLAYEKAPIIGASARVHAMERQRDAWRATAAQADKSAKAWEESYRLSEKTRIGESRQAADAVADLDKACEARVSRARRSAEAIRIITTTEPKHDQNGCPTRELIPPGRLRDAIGTSR